MEQKELIEALTKKIADLEKAVSEKIESKEAIEKRMNDLVEARADALRKTMLNEMRKSRFSQRETSEPPAELIIEKSDNPRVQEFQRWNDDVLILSKMLNVHPHTLKIWEKNAARYAEMKKAMDSVTSGSGSEWIPTDFSSDVIERFRLARQVAGLFTEITMPSDPYKMPGIGSAPSAYLVSEQSTTDPSTKSYTASGVGSRNVTLNAIKLGVRVPFTYELSEDAIFPVLEMIKNQMVMAMIDGQEDALINGDTTATHMDADVTSAADPRKAWKGLRKHALDANQVSLSSLTLSALRGLRSKMGKYAASPRNLVYLCSAKGHVKLLDLGQIETLEKYGPNATVLTGEVGRIDGIPVVVSEYVRDSLNTVGVNDATTNNKGEILLVHAPAFVIGNRRKMSIKSFDDVQNDLVYMVSSWRGDFQPIYDATTEPVVVEGVNLTV